MSISAESPSSAALQNRAPGLHDILDSLRSGPWRFIQLRGSPVGCTSAGEGDIDLLGTRRSVETLLQSAFEWVRAGRCHLRVQARNDNKTSLALIARDGLDAVHLDLWVNLWQILDPRACLRFEDCEHLLPAVPSAIARLPPQIEACIYLHHLVAKRKDLSGAKAKKRLQNYSLSCAGNPDLAAAIRSTASLGRIGADTLRLSRRYLAEAKVLPAEADAASVPKKLIAEAAATMLAASPTTKGVAVTGCDGSGKTSLIKGLVAGSGGSYRMRVGKRLYRNSLLYKLAVIFVRPLLRQGRDRFDDVLGFWIYIRAAIALQIRLWIPSRGIDLFDRSLVDFLVVDRKSDHPRFHRGSWITSVLGRRIPTVHLVLPYDRLRARKAEMTLLGHKAYDEMMFAHFSRRAPTDYCVFNNGADERTSVAALDNVLRMVAGSQT